MKNNQMLSFSHPYFHTLELNMEFTQLIIAFSPNKGKYGSKKLRTLTPVTADLVTFTEKFLNEKLFLGPVSVTS